MSDQSFGRIVKLRVYATNETLTAPGDEALVSYTNGYTEFSSVVDTQTVYGQVVGSPGYRIKGKVTLVAPTVGVGTNPITFSIFNLGEHSRNLICSKIGTRVEIFAGYGASIRQIALGDILWARTQKIGADFITEVIAGDSHFALANGEINQSFEGPVAYIQVVNAITDALATMGMYKGTIDVPTGSFNTGYVLTGSPMVRLHEVCKTINRQVTFVGNQINILPIGQDAGLPTIEVSVDTGLVGIPEVHPPGVIGVVPTGVPVTPQVGLSFKHLMRPEIGLAQKVKIKSKFVNGEYVVSRVVHDFDSWEGPFYTECECFIPGAANG